MYPAPRPRFLPAPSLGTGALAALLLLFAASAAPARAADSGPVVDVTGGQIQGRTLDGGKGAVFRGVPFARPPVGDLRWREPMPVVPWEGVRDAGKSGPPAAQPDLGWNHADAAAGSEDCLYLDVWTPAAHPKEPLPVMVWIHGGANVAGAGGFDPLYDGRALISHGVVLVVVEYRLGLFGFFSHPELTRESPHHASGNYGVMDQAAALKWVRDNIAVFGGDPGNVTVFGQSAGSMDVLALMASPLGRGLFQRAIAESGPSSLSGRTTRDDAERAGVRTAERLGAPADAALRFLRSLSTETLLKSGAWAPALGADGWVLPETAADAFSKGGEAHVPLIIGTLAIELPMSGTPAQIRKSIEETFGDLAPRALALYGLSGNATGIPADPVYGDLGEQWGSDRMRCGAIVQGEWHSRAGNPTWVYQFCRAIPPHPRTSHSGDLPYVFGNLYSTGSLPGDYQDSDRRLSAAVQTYWTQFAKTGNPNGPGVPTWPAYDGTARHFLNVTASAGIVVADDPRGPVCDLFRELMRRPAAAP